MAAQPRHPRHRPACSRRARAPAQQGQRRHRRHGLVHVEAGLASRRGAPAGIRPPGRQHHPVARRRGGRPRRPRRLDEPAHPRAQVAHLRRGQQPGTPADAGHHRRLAAPPARGLHADADGRPGTLLPHRRAAGSHRSATQLADGAAGPRLAGSLRRPGARAPAPVDAAATRPRDPHRATPARQSRDHAALRAPGAHRPAGRHLPGRHRHQDPPQSLQAGRRHARQSRVADPRLQRQRHDLRARRPAGRRPGGRAQQGGPRRLGARHAHQCGHARHRPDPLAVRAGGMQRHPRGRGPHRPGHGDGQGGHRRALHGHGDAVARTPAAARPGRPCRRRRRRTHREAAPPRRQARVLAGGPGAGSAGGQPGPGLHLPMDPPLRPPGRLRVHANHARHGG